MQSKNKKTMTRAEAFHVECVAALPCSVCDQAGPSEVHETKQGAWWLSAAICPDCHRGSHNGWHGRRHIWKVKRMDELDALAVTIRRLIGRELA